MTRSLQEPNCGWPLGEVVHYEQNLVHDECLEQGTTSKEHGLSMQDVNRNTLTDYAALPRMSAADWHAGTQVACGICVRAVSSVSLGGWRLGPGNGNLKAI